MILRLVAAIRVLTRVFLVPRDTSAKDCAIALHVAMFLAMPLAFLCVQAVRSIAWRSDQTAKNCSLTLPRLLPSPSLLQYCRIYLSAAEIALHVSCAWSLAWCMCVCVCACCCASSVVADSHGATFLSPSEGASKRIS